MCPRFKFFVSSCCHNNPQASFLRQTAIFMKKSFFLLRFGAKLGKVYCSDGKRTTVDKTPVCDVKDGRLLVPSLYGEDHAAILVAQCGKVFDMAVIFQDRLHRASSQSLTGKNQPV